MRGARAFCEWFGIQPTAGRVCASLYEADTRPLTVAQLVGRLRHQPGTIHAALVAVRLAVEPGSLVTDGLRYALTDAGMDECNAALADARARRAAA